MEKLKNDKRGVFGVILFFIILFTILIVGFVAVITLTIIDYSSDIITPVVQEIGIVGPTNITTVAEYTVTPINTVLSALPWLLGFVYIIALVFSIILIMVYNSNPHPSMIGFYLMMIILLIFGSIIISNIYQDLYLSNDEIGQRLQEQTIMSYMILYSPFILSLIAFITGIYLFTRVNEGGIEI